MRWALPLLVIACRDPAPITKAELGRRLFEDTTLSQPPGQACADCHDARVAFADFEGDRTSAGAVRDRFGVRNAPTILYARFIPPLQRDADGAAFGGLFWDGHASSLEDQAALPFLNPLEMNNSSKAEVVAKVRKRHGAAFRTVFGAGALDDVDAGFARITQAIAEFERTPALSPFASPYDHGVPRSVEEARGFALFEQHCTTCHAPPMFTTHRYVNLGVPRFNDNPFYETQPAHVDRGLAETTHDPRDDGRFRIPTLRNVARTAPYGHNGYYRRLDEMIAFHARPTAPPEVVTTVDRSALAGFHPDERDITDLVAFLHTLTDAR